MPKLKPNTYHNTPEEDAAITAAAMSDPDSIPLTDAEWDELMARRNRRMGRPPVAAPKRNITLRLSQPVVDQFRATGKGWQTRIDEALKEWLDNHRLVP